MPNCVLDKLSSGLFLDDFQLEVMCSPVVKVERECLGAEERDSAQVILFRKFQREAGVALSNCVILGND